MEKLDRDRVQSNSLTEFARVMEARPPLSCRPPSDVREEDGSTPRLNLDQDNVKNGLGRLVLTLVRLLHELLERQAIRRFDAGYLTDAEIERVGVTLMQQAREIDRLRREFGLEEEDLNLDLGPLGKLL